ncbi:hypothetical protein ACFCX4_27825 [Kitasatospora sp. NPDC056327]|uniref:hypothetical protein n=1 Tax=Kitasatospora sp. NPDC056327 TaxID=3345785 RepID=UPI0035DD4C9F
MGREQEFGGAAGGGVDGAADGAGERRQVWVARWAVVAVAGIVLAVVLVTSGEGGARPAPVGLTPVPAPVSTTAAGTTAGSPAPSPVPVAATAAPPRRAVVPGATPADPGPAAVVGDHYPVDWDTHCGIAHLRFAGRMWRTDRPPVVPHDLPGALGPTSWPLVLPGYATLTAAGRLRFDAPGYLAEPVLFEPSTLPRICE